MKKVSIVLYLIAFVFLINSCRKADTILPLTSNVDQYITVDIDGTSITYNNDLSKVTTPKVLNVFSKSQKTISMGLYAPVDLTSGSTTLGAFTITLVNIDLDNISLPFSSYAGEDFTAAYPAVSYIDKDGKLFTGQAKSTDNLPYLTVRISSKTNDVLEGTVFGIMYDSQTTNTKKVIREGKFRIQLTR
ncbi:MAG: hypothetical protein ACKVOU_15205 [Cytophagales bacterium]